MTALLLATLLPACNGVEYASVEKRRILDSFPYVDCGVVAPGQRQVCTVPLFSEGDGTVTLLDVRAVDVSFPDGASADGSFLVSPTDWQDPACGGGTCRELPGYDDASDDDTLALPITFAPDVEGFFQAELTVWSDDSESLAAEPLPDDPGTERAVWKVQLRGYSRDACARAWPSFVDFGKRPSGGNFNVDVRVENCGLVTLEVGGASEEGTGTEEMGLYTSFPLYVLPGTSENVVAGWSVGLDAGQPGAEVTTTFAFSANDDALAGSTVTAIGNDCAQSVDPSWDADGDGWFSCGGDCDDAERESNPGKTERAGDGADNDCDGTVDEAANPVGSDDDGDGYSETSGDCDDASDGAYPGAPEQLDQRDNDCDGLVDDGTDRYDDDGDGLSERAGDCDDADRLVAPSVAETPDGRDNDCDGTVDEGSYTVDDDLDGFRETEDDPAQGDCDDGDPWVFVGAFEFCDGYDNDCDRVVDEGPDDVPDGACAFLPGRRDSDPDSGVAVAPRGACGSPVAPAGLVTVLTAVVALARGRSR